MRLIVRSLKNVVRKKSRSILTCIVLLIISVFVLIGLSIRAGTTASILEARKNMGSEITLSINMQKMIDDAMKAREEEGTSNGSDAPRAIGSFFNQVSIAESEAKALAGSSYIEGYDFIYSGNIMSTIENIEVDTSQFGGRGGIGNSSSTDKAGTAWNSFGVSGNRYPQLTSEFKNGTYVIEENNGEFYTVEDVDNGAMVCLIDSRLAELNSLKVGDKIKIKAFNRSPMMVVRGPDGSSATSGQQENTSVDDLETFEFTIKGIYTNYSTGDGSGEVQMAGSLYTPYTSIRTVMQSVPATETEDDADAEDTDKNTLNSAVFYLKNPNDKDAFIAEAEQNGLDTEKYTLGTNEAAYNATVGQMEKLSGFANIMIITVLIAGAVIIMLIMTLNARERKGEIGILRALGAKRGKIALQFVVETVAIALVALVVGGGVGIVSAQKVADYMLERQTAAEEQVEQAPGGATRLDPGGATGRSNRQGGGGFRPGQFFGTPIGAAGVGNVDVIDSVTTQIGWVQIGELIGAALLISLLGSLCAAYWVMKVEPMRILSNRE